MSRQDAQRYRREDTEAKLATLARQQGESGMPMTCATFNDKRPGICAACRHWGAIRSPVLLGFGAPLVLEPASTPAHIVTGGEAGHEAAARDFILPHASLPAKPVEIARLRDRRFELVMPDEVDESRPMGVSFIEHGKGENDAEIVKRVPVTFQPVFVAEAAWKRDAEGRIVFDYWTRIYDPKRRSWDEVPLPAHLFAVPNQLLPALYSHGLTLCGGHVSHDRMVEYMRAYITHIRHTREPVAQLEHMGWTAGRTFTEGGHMFRAGDDPARGKPNVVIEPAFLSHTAASIASSFTPKGMLEAWKRAANLYARPGQEAMSLAIFASFGAPLLHFTDASGFLVYFTGQSGTGKTSLLRVAAAIWADPQKLLLHSPASKYGSTRNALMGLLGILKNLPLMFDELALAQPEEVFPLLHALASGQERSRMTSALDLKPGGTWKSTYLGTGNRSLRAMLAGCTDEEHIAVVNRMIEVALPSIDPDDRRWMADRPVVEAVMHNYGIAGQIFSQWIVANVDRLPALIDAKREALMRRANAGRGERLWFAGLAATFVAADLAKAAGLHDIAVGRVEQWAIDVLLPVQRQEVIDRRRSGEAVLGEFLHENIGNTLVVTRSHRPGVGEGEIDYAVRGIAPGGMLKIRYEQKSGRAFISRKAFQEWCRRRHVDYRQALDDLARKGQLVKEHHETALARGLPEYGAASTARIECFCVNATDDMMGVADDDDSREE